MLTYVQEKENSDGRKNQVCVQVIVLISITSTHSVV